MAKKKPTRKKAPAVPPPSKRELAEYFAVEEQKRDHQRHVTDFNRLQTATELKVLDYVRAEGGKERCVILHGYRLSIEFANERVEWKTELLSALAKEVGKTKAARIAARILKESGQKEVANIEAPITPPGTGKPTFPKPEPAPGRLF